MTIDQKLEVILNSIYPKKSSLKLKVLNAIPSQGRYFVQIFKNGKGLESFSIPVQSAMRLVEGK